MIKDVKTPMEAIEKLLVCDGQRSRANRQPLFNKELLDCAIAGKENDRNSVIQLIYVNKLYFKAGFSPLKPSHRQSTSDRLSNGLDVVLRRSSYG